MPFGFYADPYKGQLPNPFNPAIVAAIARACFEAWQEVSSFTYKDSTPFDSAHYSDERELNKRMTEILNYMLDHGGKEWFSASEFQVVPRDARQVGADLDDDEQSPDLAFRLTNYPAGVSRDGCALFVECKVLDDGKSRSVTYYVETGVARFVDGKYAPKMPIGMLMAYVIGSQALPKHLDTCFKSSKAANVVRVRPDNGVSACSSIPVPPPVFKTEHKREKVPDCNAIELFHLWLTPTAITKK